MPDGATFNVALILARVLIILKTLKVAVFDSVHNWQFSTEGSSRLVGAALLNADWQIAVILAALTNGHWTMQHAQHSKFQCEKAGLYFRMPVLVMFALIFLTMSFDHLEIRQSDGLSFRPSGRKKQQQISSKRMRSKSPNEKKGRCECSHSA